MSSTGLVIIMLIPILENALDSDLLTLSDLLREIRILY